MRKKKILLILRVTFKDEPTSKLQDKKEQTTVLNVANTKGVLE